MRKTAAKINREDEEDKREAVAATTTPLPAARPSALTTIGAPCFLIYSQASSLTYCILCVLTLSCTYM